MNLCELLSTHLRDPLVFAKLLWPQVYFYSKQREIIQSVVDNDETVVPAGNMLGKDFVAGFIAVWFFLVHRECRVITTSVKDDHLRVLWGEIGRFIDTASVSLDKTKGGPLILKHRDIRKINDKGIECKISYLLGMVSEKGEGMAGHHAASTLLIVDEASGVDNVVYTQADTWAGGGTFNGGLDRKRKLIIGNPNPCTSFFKTLVKGGDLLAPPPKSTT